jgi:hypothetical protein
MTAMPEMVGLFNGFGGLASMLVAWAEFHKWRAEGWAELPQPARHRRTESSIFTAIAIAFTALVGAVTFSGSLIAFLKLVERMPGRPILFKGQQVVNILILVSIVARRRPSWSRAPGGARPTQLRRRDAHRTRARRDIGDPDRPARTCRSSSRC